jgi:DNA mismatch repair protein MutL
LRFNERGDSSRRIHILREDVARKIAAGEVIDRPFSIVRELLDNSLDAESTEISLFIEGGGLARVRVVDDGQGMSAEDLRLCSLPRATSKISDAEDLFKASSLGFRGEALASIGTCSQMEITSRSSTSETAHKLTVREGQLVSLEPCQGNRGTVVDVSQLFAAMPARRQFLKGPSAESGMCRATLVNKALSSPGVSFRFFVDASLRLFFPPQSLETRVAAAYGEKAYSSFLGRTEVSGGGFQGVLILGSPELQRKDRKLLQLFVNRRRIFEYSLIQAVEYGYSEHIPGGGHPVAFVFLEIEPGLVDFNIHPAKKEARIRILSQIHRKLSSSVRAFLSSYTSVPRADPQTPRGDAEAAPWLEQTSRPMEPTSTGQPSVGSFADLPDRGPPDRGPSDRGPSDVYKPFVPAGDKQPRFLGQTLDLFLIVEWKDSLYLIDQHAAHERVIFEKLKLRDKQSQELLFPIAFDVSDDQQEALLLSKERLASMGLALEKVGEGTFEILTLPTEFQRISEGDLVEILRELAGSLEEVEQNLLKAAACKMAVKEGQSLDTSAVNELIGAVFSLDNPRCPHGRPIWHRIERDTLFRWVQRL